MTAVGVDTHITLHCDSASIRNQCLCRLAISIQEIIDHDAPALHREMPHAGGTNARRAAGDDDDTRWRLFIHELYPLSDSVGLDKGDTAAINGASNNTCMAYSSALKPVLWTMGPQRPRSRWSNAANSSGLLLSTPNAMSAIAR